MGTLWSWLRLVPTAAIIIAAIKTNQLYQEDIRVGGERASHLEIMERMGIQCPKVVCCQILLETADLTSKIYRENHNGFGMKYNRRGHAIGTLNGHAQYESIYESIEDYRDWQKQMFGNRIFTSDEEYMNALQNLPGGRKYAEDPKYIQKLKIKYTKYYK